MKLKKSLLALGIAALAFTTACSSDEQLPTLKSFHQTAEDAAKVVEMIDSITVADMTTEQEIEQIYLEYCNLDDETQKLVTNYEKLDEHRNAITKLYHTEEKQGPRMDRSKVNIGTYCFNPQSWTDEGVQALVDCGIDFISNASYNNTLLDLLEKYNIGAFAAGVVPGWYGGGGTPANAGTMSTVQPLSAYDSGMESFVDRDCIWGIDMGDEPSALDYDHYGDIFEYIKPAFPNQILYLNLLPMNMHAENYEDYLRQFAEKVECDYICYDHYPWGKERDRGLRESLGNLQSAQKICKEYNRDLWIVIQASSQDNIPLNDRDLRLQTSLCMTYGARVFSWACWNAGWFNFHIGENSETYNAVKLVNEEVKKLSPIYSRYDVVVSGYLGATPNFATPIKNEDHCDIFDLDTIENCDVSYVKTGINPTIITGYFEKRNGEGSAIMFTNTTDPDCNPLEGEASVTFTVKDANSKITAYYNGEIFNLTNLGNGQYRFTIHNSDNVFVTIE